MNTSQYDVIVVGAGAAGLTAAIGLARAGFATIVVEAAAYPGAENWSGCVYFCENLAHADILGMDGVEALAWERRLVERGFFGTDGHGLLGMTYRDPGAFRHCYTVLRPIYDHHLAQMAQRHGVAIVTETTVESLIRDGGKIIGVCTSRGPLYADLVFLAEGDASHLVTREGYERYTDAREAPKFLQGIKQVIELPAGAVEEAFRVGPEDGVAYELLVRNGMLRGKRLHLNMGGFIYTNRQSLSVGLVLPADNLRDHFDGDPNLLIDWFTNLPALQPWLRNGRRGVFGAKIIRGGGIKDIPHLIDDGLAIGGAASAIGVDFPYPNFTGPATGMGLLLAQAATRIRAEGGVFSRENLQRHYLSPLQRTHYWQDVSFLRRWPGYVKRTQVFFDQNLDLALGSAYIWTRPNQWLVTKWIQWLRLLRAVSGPAQWHTLRVDLRHLMRALRLREVARRPPLGRLLLDGTVNALRDLFGAPRPDVASAGVLKVRYTAAADATNAGEITSKVPAPLQRWFQRFAPVLASVARHMYANEPAPLASRLPDATRLLLRQVNVLDLFAAGVLGVAAGLTGMALVCWDRFRGLFPGRSHDRRARGLYQHYASSVRQTTDLTPAAAAAGPRWEERLATLAYQPVKASHVQVLWPRSLPEKSDIARQGLWHVCPAHVYEARPGPQGQVQVVVNFENCIKCETCWRASDLVTWGRDGQHRFEYPVGSPVATRLIDAMGSSPSTVRPALPRTLDPWKSSACALADKLTGATAWQGNGAPPEFVGEVLLLLTQLEKKLEEFDGALADEPRTVDRPRADYLEMLARYAQQLAARLVDVVATACAKETDRAERFRDVLTLATALAAKAEERSRQTWDQRFHWAAGTGRQLREHHVAGLRALLGAPSDPAAVPIHPRLAWLRVEDHREANAQKLDEWAARLDTVFPRSAWRELEAGATLTPEQDATLRTLVAEVPRVDPNDLAETLHPPLRKGLLAELGRRDPSLAYRVASHLWARDLASLATGSGLLGEAAGRWARVQEWACFSPLESAEVEGGGCSGKAAYVPAATARAVLLLAREQLIVVDAASATGTCSIEPDATLGLRGAGLTRIVLDNLSLPVARATVDYHRFRRIWHILSAADLTSIARGMADVLCDRAIGHAATRVQFPGLFHDEEARDTIGKFGAVKKMIAEMAARRYLIETLDACLAPTDFSSSARDQAGLIKATVAEALGTAPGSLTYNAGQVFGGTGYSEDDILSKYYRDAAAWRFLGATNVDVYRRHGQELLRNWRADGRRLAIVPDEGSLFDEMAQRKALQAELDEVRNLRSRLRGALAERQHGNDSVETEFCEALARQDGHLLASKALLLRTHARLERGLSAETEIALVRVWMEYVAESLEKFDAVVRPAERPVLRPVVEPAAGAPVARYADFLSSPGRYESGDFLVAPLDLAQPRFVPEMVRADPALAEADRDFRARLAAHFGRPRSPDAAEPYERYIERRHRPDPEDLDFCRANGFFRMPIERELGGEGRSKAEYYLLTTNSQRLVDVAISLTIQANTSIGTSPVLIARDKDLPKAQKDLAPFVGDPALQREILERLEALLKLTRGLRQPEPGSIDSAMGDVQRRLQETVFSRTVLKVLTHRFGEAWQRAGAALAQFDFSGLRATFEEAVADWKDACRRAEDLHAELRRRRDACELFLRWVASGQISAFALTEPSAGSDTARVATRAKLRSAPLDKVEEGVYRFSPVGGKEPGILLDAARLVFTAEGVYYRRTPSVQPAPVRLDEYDYETDAAKKRYVQEEDRRIYFSDIAQVRERTGRLWYDYWELTGSKMWITNGRMAGVMCLYAKVQEPWVSGVTGFIVDRHADGLIVGKDEAKMGQCGSPTNEISLQAVRVPRENVLGLESRGQVNALETLNVGRAGLAMSSMAQMEGIIAASRVFAAAEYGEVPDWVAWRLERMEEIRFIAEALGFDVVGRFEHPRTKSVRMESAIAKMLNSELLHRLIEWAEDIHGLEGQTQRHLIEKRKRDARILNIYEGTNEIQRSLVLKDLIADVAPRWGTGARGAAQPMGQEALELESLKTDFRQRVEAARAIFGHDLWQNPNLQANCFLLAEMAAWLKAAESSLGRLAWLYRRELASLGDSTEPVPGSELELSEQLRRGHGAFARCQVEVRNRLQRFDDELTHLRRGFYAPEIRAASLLFLREGLVGARPLKTESAAIQQPLQVLVVVEPTAAHLPQPHVRDGRLVEPRLTLSAMDRAALEMALRIRDETRGGSGVEVAAVGPRSALAALREAISVGADRVRLVVPELDAVTPDSAAAALAHVVHSDKKYDLILCGESKNHDEGVAGQLVARLLGLAHAGAAHRVSVRALHAEAVAVLEDNAGVCLGRRVLPVSVAVEAGQPLRSFRIEGFLGGLSKSVEIVRWPKKVPARSLSLEVMSARAAASEQTHALKPTEAAERLLRTLGQGGTSFAHGCFAGPLPDVDRPDFVENDSTYAIMAIVAADGDGRLQPTAPLVVRAAHEIAGNAAETSAARVVTLLLTSTQENVQRRALAQLESCHRGSVVLVAAERLDARNELMIAACRELLEGRVERNIPSSASSTATAFRELPKSVVRVVVGEPWTEDVFATLCTRSGQVEQVAMRVRSMAFSEGEIVCTSTHASGKLAAQQRLDPTAHETVWISLSGDAEISGSPTEPGPLQVQRWLVPTNRFFARDEARALLEEIKKDAGVTRLADADFIIDVGYGVTNRDGYEAVIEPLERTLRAIGVRRLVVGGSRKVTEELHLLPADRQIGQSGASVNPQVLLAIGVSGAPQHVNYIGPRATILAFNRDAEAPLLTLNSRQPRPRVFPVIGDLFETVPVFTAALGEELSGQAEKTAQEDAGSAPIAPTQPVAVT